MYQGIFSKKYIGKRISDIRKNNNLSINEFAKKINVANSTVKSWELGNNVPTLQSMVSICNNFHVSLDSFILYK